MFRNYIKILFRNLWKNKSFSFVAIAGLSIGMAAVVLIAIFLKTEHSFDNFHQAANRIYRITTQVKSPNGELRHYATTMPPVAPSLKNEYPQIEQAVRFRRSDNHIISYGENKFTENKVLYADSGFFNIFSFLLQYGNRTSALQLPNSVVLSSEIAKKYFGNENPVGKILKADTTTWLVTGVLEPVPVKSHIQTDFIVSFGTWKIPQGYPVTLDSWTWVTFPTYILLKENVRKETIEEGLNSFIKKYGGDEIASRRTLHLQPLSEIYFSSELLETATFKTGDKKQSNILAIIAGLILVIGGFNFMTLFTAAVVKRTKELGMRKVIGANRENLVIQLLSEALLLSFLCVPIAFVITALSAEWITSLIDFPIAFSIKEIPFAFSVFLLIATVTGLLAASYPALRMTTFSPTATFRNLFKVPTGVSFKKALVITQFTISAILIMAAILMYRQSQFISKKELGFEEERLLRIEMPGEELEKKYSFIRNELLNKPGVTEVTKAGNFFRESIGSVPIYPDAIVNRDRGIQMNIHGIHYDFFETFGIKLKQGRFIQQNFSSDSADAIVLNQSAATALGWQDNAVGKKLQIGEIKQGTVVGVVNDFHFATLHKAIGPLVMYIPPTRLDNIFIKVAPGKLTSTAKYIESSWPQLAGDVPLNLFFADENIAALYAKDKKFMQLIFLFCGLSVLIACLGLYALTVLITRQRIKEIGIRKVLGASISSIAVLVSKEFVLLIGVAMLIALPSAWYFLNQWLNEFAYHVELTWWVFLLAIVAALFIALLTIGFHIVKAAIANPVKSLRTE